MSLNYFTAKDAKGRKGKTCFTSRTFASFALSAFEFKLVLEHAF